MVPPVFPDVLPQIAGGGPPAGPSRLSRGKILFFQCLDGNRVVHSRQIREIRCGVRFRVDSLTIWFLIATEI